MPNHPRGKVELSITSTAHLEGRHVRQHLRSYQKSVLADCFGPRQRCRKPNCRKHVRVIRLQELHGRQCLFRTVQVSPEEKLSKDAGECPTLPSPR